MASKPPVAVYDACVLYPVHLRNVLIQCIHTPRTAELGRVRGSLLMYAADKIQAVI